MVENNHSRSSTSRRFNIVSFAILLIFALFHSGSGFSQQLDTISNEVSSTQPTKQDSIIPSDTTKSAFIRQIQELGIKEYKSSVEKFESRKIYLKQQDLLHELKKTTG